MGGKAAKADESAALPADEERGNEPSESEAATGSNNAEKAASPKKAPPIDGRVGIVSKSRAGKKIIAKTGEVIEFDADGKASVRAEDAVYLAGCAGFELE